MLPIRSASVSRRTGARPSATMVIGTAARDCAAPVTGHAPRRRRSAVQAFAGVVIGMLLSTLVETGPDGRAGRGRLGKKGRDHPRPSGG